MRRHTSYNLEPADITTYHSPDALTTDGGLHTLHSPTIPQNYGADGELDAPTHSQSSTTSHP